MAKKIKTPTKLTATVYSNADGSKVARATTLNNFADEAGLLAHLGRVAEYQTATAASCSRICVVEERRVIVSDMNAIEVWELV